MAAGDPDAAARWRAERQEAAAAHGEALERRRRADSDRARGMLAELVARALRDGPEPVPLRTVDPDGRRTYRTGLRGWYLRRDHRVAVGTDGEYYVLVRPGGLLGALRRYEPAASDPPLVIGSGGRDGESIDLADAVARVLSGE
ncbi:MAG: hypothetical protein KJ792_01700 [Actinobacteria bacterium]|nr:hypothetical protein [Actinomycetota bacterium]